MHYSECKNARAAIVRTIVMKFDTVKSVALPISTSNIINWNRDGNGKIESGFSDIDRIKLLQVLLHADTKTKHLILGCLSLNTEKRVTVICMPAKFCEKKWKTRKITKIIENQKILRDRKKKKLIRTKKNWKQKTVNEITKIKFQNSYWTTFQKSFHVFFMIIRRPKKRSIEQFWNESANMLKLRFHLWWNPLWMIEDKSGIGLKNRSR